jgi:signal transduction histidine kinase
MAKSRFLAAASHDLRQPLHALGLLVAKFRADVGAAERLQVVERIDAAVSEMNELFNELLDISKLDAGVFATSVSEFPIARLLTRIESTFSHVAQAKNLHLRVISSSAWVRSDVVMLERILFNLVSNAARFTSQLG